MNKKYLLIIAAVITALIMSLSACGTGAPGEGTSEEASVPVSAVDDADTQGEQSAPERTLDPSEVSLNLSHVTDSAEADAYKKTIVNGENEQALDKETSKTGMFCILRDQFNERDRYYVWGYGDEAKTTDWQWEFIPADASTLPAQGSIITVSGKLVRSDEALDRIWIENAAVEVKTAYIPDGAYDVDCRFMGNTLERVQVQNVNLYPDYFDGKTLAVYGRASGSASVRNPYDGAEGSIVEWSMEFASEYKNPEADTMILLTGSIADGHVTDAVVSVLK